jgi:hypothetical protein
MVKRSRNVIEKCEVNANLRTPHFLVTFSRGKKACILPILAKSETSENSQNYSSLVINSTKDITGV